MTVCRMRVKIIRTVLYRLLQLSLSLFVHLRAVHLSVRLHLVLYACVFFSELESFRFSACFSHCFLTGCRDLVCRYEYSRFRGKSRLQNNPVICRVGLYLRGNITRSLDRSRSSAVLISQFFVSISILQCSNTVSCYKCNIARWIRVLSLCSLP